MIHARFERRELAANVAHLSLKYARRAVENEPIDVGAANDRLRTRRRTSEENIEVLGVRRLNDGKRGGENG
jgi:hypothetical protein